jgi:hypothetical protein
MKGLMMFKRKEDDWRKLFKNADIVKVEHLEGEEARQSGIQLVKDLAGGVDTLEEAHQILFGRPTLELSHTREKTEQVQVRIPHSWKRRIDEAAHKAGQTRSVFLRNLIKKEIF